MKIGSKLLAVIALMATVAPWARGEIGVSDDEILIGSCSALEGTPHMGAPQSAGARAYLEFANRESGGVHGRKLKLLAYNDGYDAEKAIECFNRLISDRVFMGAFFTGSATSAKYTVMAESNKVPILGFISGAEFLYQPVKHYVFPVRASFGTEVEQAVNHLWDQVGARKIAVVYQYDAMGASELDSVRKALRERGTEPVAVVSMPVKGADIIPIVNETKASHAEAVLLCTTIVPAATDIIVKSAAAGYQPIFVNIGARDLLAQSLGKAHAGNGTIITQVIPAPNQTSLPAVKLFRRVMAKYAPKQDPDYYALEGFLDAMIAVEGLRKAGKDLTREKLVDALESLRGYDLGLGPDMKLAYSHDRHEAFERLFFTQAIDGRVVPMNDWKSVHLPAR